jgi:hypothetical protein
LLLLVALAELLPAMRAKPSGRTLASPGQYDS